MGSDIFVTASGAAARLADLEVIANNLANVDTLGFRADRSVFHSVLASSLRSSEGDLPGAPGRAFAALGGLATDLSGGPVERTGAPLDAAIDGDGFFVVETPEGERYTRAGSFAVDASRRLVARDGSPVLGSSGPLRVGSRPSQIDRSGQLVDDVGRAQGRLRIVRFERPELLEKVSANLWRAAPEAGAEDVDDPVLVPRSLEGSNVSSVREMSRLIAVQRAFEANMRTLASQDSTTERLLQEVGS